MSHRKLWLVAGVALLGSFVLTSAVQAKPKRRPAGGQMSPQMLQKFDKNGNGQLDPDEKQAAMQAMQQRKGAGGKGAPGKGQAGKGAAGNPQMQQQMLQKFDKNGNGQLDPDEKQAAMQAMQQRKGAGPKQKK